MRVLVVTPPETAAGLDRRMAWIRRRFGDAGIVVAASADAAADAAIVVLIRGDDGVCAPPPAGFDGRLYVQEQDGRLALQNRPFDGDEVASIDAHVFSRMAPADTAGYYHFPYGYLARYPGMGPIDSFGFRASVDWAPLRARQDSHKLVVVSGGSAVWSQCCLADEAFPAVLEGMLNDWATAERAGVTFSVVNLGLFGNLVLHQSINYMLFAERLRPDYVIAHDGFNDLIFALMSDPWLLAEHSIAYQPEFEGWARLLHKAPGDALTHQELPYGVLNLPHVAVRAYGERKAQFRRLVEGTGARFIWGLQPCIFSKGALSPEEQSVVGERHAVYGHAHRKIEFVFEEYLVRGVVPTDVPFVNCHSAFKAFGADQHLFADHVHMTPQGDRHIASLYFDVIRRGAATHA